MATVACPGCGLPRSEAAVGATPCPVCDAVFPLTGGSQPPRARKKHDPDPTAGMAADASELNASRAPAGGSRWLLVAVTFILGALCGVAGVLGYQAIDANRGKGEPEVAAKPDEAPPLPTGGLHPPLAKPAVAPMPHEPPVSTVVMEPGADPDPKLVQPPPMPGRVTVIELNDPDATYAVPFPMKNGEHVVLRGKVKTLRVPGLDAGATLDASHLEASVVIVTGKIDNGSTLKVSAPDGTVHITGKIDGKSLVEIHAARGEVKFMLSTTPEREGSKIDGGSAVTVTARVVEFKGDITGTGTKVSLALTRGAWLRVAAVGGTAAVEYRSLAAGWSPPDVIVGPVAGTATFRNGGVIR